jgi:hypothetical protein
LQALLERDLLLKLDLQALVGDSDTAYHAFSRKHKIAHQTVICALAFGSGA